MKCHFCNVVGVSQSEADQAREVVQGYDTLCLACAESLKQDNEKIAYEEVIMSLFSMTKPGNSLYPKFDISWQNSMDATKRCEFNRMIWQAIECIAGPEILQNWCDTDEIDLSLASRN